MRYSLSDYILAITIPADLQSAAQLESNTITVGGEGSYLDSLSADYDNDLFSTTGDATGSWVHNKNLSKVGKITITINQLSEKVARFKKIANIYYNSSEDFEGLNVSLTDRRGNEVLSGEDCYFVRIPNQSFANEAATQEWVLTSGSITFND